MSKLFYGHTQYANEDDDAPNEHPVFGDQDMVNSPEQKKEDYLEEMKEFIAKVKIHESFAEWITDARFAAQGEDRVEFDKALDLWGSRKLVGFDDYPSFHALENLCHKHAPKEEHDSEEDMVNSPKHYAEAPVECIDAMRHCFGEEQVRIYAKIAAFKYLWRSQQKHATDSEDLAKAQWYIQYANGNDPRVKS